MKKEIFEEAKEKMNCIEGGVLEACLIVREYLQNVDEEGRAVSTEEYVRATELLMAYAWGKKEDVVPELYYCDNDCSRIDKEIFCEGEFSISRTSDAKAKRLCPHFKI